MCWGNEKRSTKKHTAKSSIMCLAEFISTSKSYGKAKANRTAQKLVAASKVFRSPGLISRLVWVEYLQFPSSDCQWSNKILVYFSFLFLRAEKKEKHQKAHEKWKCGEYWNTIFSIRFYHMWWQTECRGREPAPPLHIATSYLRRIVNISHKFIAPLSCFRFSLRKAFFSRRRSI